MSIKGYVIAGLHHSGALGLVRRLNRGKFLGATVLLYHRVMPVNTPEDHYVRLMGDPTAPELEQLLRYLKRSFRFSTPQECVERWARGGEVDPFTVLLTFDDGYADMHEELLPVLRRCEVPATVFVTTGAVSGRAVWFQRLFSAIDRTSCVELPPFDTLRQLPLRTPRQKVEAIEAISALQRGHAAAAWERMIERLVEALQWDGSLDGERMMSWAQVRDLDRSGWVTIGGHTVTHPALEQCDERRARDEIRGSADELRARLGSQFLAFSYPQGGCPPAGVQQMVRDAGYACAFTGRNVANTSGTGLFRLGRRHVQPGDVARASLQLSGLRGAAPPARESGDAASGAMGDVVVAQG